MEKYSFKTRSQVASEYRIDVRTLISRLLEVGIVLPKGLICPKDVELIYEKLGTPPFLT
jgi:hypothetical protein